MDIEKQWQKKQRNLFHSNKVMHPGCVTGPASKSILANEIIFLKKIVILLPVLVLSLFVSVGIELLQLITNYRSTDIDDMILNTIGGCFGFILYQFIGVL